ncbi:MAG: TPM domain-containing protein, partial [Armatimonadetes bacterium]|nr:TPM domain-containing protein [Akkermansiaceae bacterium]
MTRCPYCKTPLKPEISECPACKLTFPRTCALVGALPRIHPMAGDTTGQMKGSSIGKIRNEIFKIQRHFPQLVIQVVVHEFPADHPFLMHAFWLFNAGAFAGEGKRGKDNHALLIVIDPVRRESEIVPGYGLESLLKQEALDHLLEMSGPAFQANKW